MNNTTRKSPSKKNPNNNNTSKSLLNLPSNGLFSSSVVSSNLGGMRVYVTDHDTSPLKQKADSSAKGVGAKEGSRKRVSERVVDGRVTPKRAACQQEGPRSRVPENLNALTVERIRVLLRERGLSIRGRKDELIARLRSALD